MKAEEIKNKLSKVLKTSFENYNNSELSSAVYEEIKKHGFSIEIKTKLNASINYQFKTAIRDVSDYLGLYNNNLDIEKIQGYLNEERNKAVESCNFESASILNHIIKSVTDIEQQSKGTEEISELFKLIPPYKLMKYDINISNNTILVTIITAFKPYSDALLNAFNAPIQTHPIQTNYVSQNQGFSQ